MDTKPGEKKEGEGGKSGRSSFAALEFSFFPFGRITAGTVTLPHSGRRNFAPTEEHGLGLPADQLRDIVKRLLECSTSSSNSMKYEVWVLSILIKKEDTFKANSYTRILFSIL